MRSIGSFVYLAYLAYNQFCKFLLLFSVHYMFTQWSFETGYSSKMEIVVCLVCNLNPFGRLSMTSCTQEQVQVFIIYVQPDSYCQYCCNCTVLRITLYSYVQVCWLLASLTAFHLPSFYVTFINIC